MRMVYKNNNPNISMAEYRDQLFEFYFQRNYDYFCTLSLPNDNVEKAERLLKKWRGKLRKKAHIQIAYVGNIITSKFTGAHVHLLMLGRNHKGETISNEDKKILGKFWAATSACDFHIRDYEDSGAEDYITKAKNTPINDFELVIPHNKKLLEEHRKNN